MGVVLILLTMGLLLIFDVTAAQALSLHQEGVWMRPFFKQAVLAGCAIIIAIFSMKLSISRILRWSPLFFWGLSFLLVLVLIPGCGQKIHGAKRWINWGGIHFQPSEWMKIAMPLYVVHRLHQSEGKITPSRFFLEMGRMFLPLILIWIEPDNGTVGILLIVLFTLFWLSAVPRYCLLIPMLLFGTAILGVVIYVPYVRDRITAYLHPDEDILGKGHQPYQAKIAIGSGGLYGKEGVQKFHYLPEARHDYIAAIYAEEQGFLGMLWLLLLYSIIAIIGFSISGGVKEAKEGAIALSSTLLIVLQSTLNLAIVAGILPSKGMSLPFFSQGGSALLSHGMAIGLLLRIANSGGGHQIVQK
ncbi:MAG: putative peptidoglycan glycosyltransferase FtsW [Chlamydiota bacterium]|nr:putative peptidoglycan glycosyltransferase FtsW [Chlamydiota bacterium]